MDKKSDIPFHKSSRTTSRTTGDLILEKLTSWKTHPGSNGQHFNCGISESSGWPFTRFNSDRTRNLGYCCTFRNNDRGQTPGGPTERSRRSFEPNKSPKYLQLVYAPKAFQSNRRYFGATHYRQVCGYHQLQVKNIQQSVSGSLHVRSRCTCPTGLECTQQLCELSFRNDPQSAQCDKGSKSRSDLDSTPVDKSTLVPYTCQLTGKTSIKITKTKQHVDIGKTTRNVKKQALEDVRLENIRQKVLNDQKWPPRASFQIRFSLTPFTLYAYNRVLGKFRDFCVSNDSSFPPKHSAIIADFLCDLADSSERPK